MNAPPLVAETLARFTAGLSFERIPADVAGRAKYLMLDAVGIALASTGFDFARRTLTALRGLAGAGDTPVIGLPARLPLRDAALRNGVDVLIHNCGLGDRPLAEAEILKKLYDNAAGVVASERARGIAGWEREVRRPCDEHVDAGNDVERSRPFLTGGQ